MKPSPRWIMCCGMIRSGSTLTYQLAKEMVERSHTGCGIGYAEGEDFAKLVATAPKYGIRVVKLHRATPEALQILAQGEGLAIYTFRDLRDVAASAMEQFGLNFQQLWNNDWLESAVGEGAVWRSQTNVTLFRYEDFFQDLPGTIRSIAQAARIDVTEEDVVRIADQHAIGAQKQRADRVGQAKHPTSFDPETLLHSGHIQSGHPGRYRRTLTPEQVRLIEQRFRDWLDHNHYSIQGHKMPDPLDETFVPHIGWLSHQTGDEVSRLLREGHFESAEQAFFWRYLRADDTVIDCGAHIGLYSMLAAGIVGRNGKVLSFEPNPETAQVLESNVRAARGGPIAIHRKALSSRRGTAQLSREKSGLAAHSTIVDRPNEEAYSIETDSIDSIVGGSGNTVVALLKIDAEGHETEILEGARETLSAQKIQVIMLEFTESVLQQHGLDSQRLAKTVDSLNLTLCRYNPDRNRLESAKITEPVWYENLFAARDVDAANQRLATAPAAQERIAIDILKRAHACNLYKELEELDRYKAGAKLTSEFREWAEEVEERLAAERRRVCEFEKWAMSCEVRLADATKLAEANRVWAEEAEARAALQQDLAAQFKAWAENAELRLADATKLAEANRVWAEEAEARAALQHDLAVQFKAWAENVELRLVDTSRLAEANKQWALRTEQLLATERNTSAKHLTWAQNVERLLNDERAARATT